MVDINSARAATRCGMQMGVGRERRTPLYRRQSADVCHRIVQLEREIKYPTACDSLGWLDTVQRACAPSSRRAVSHAVTSRSHEQAVNLNTIQVVMEFPMPPPNYQDKDIIITA